MAFNAQSIYKTLRQYGHSPVAAVLLGIAFVVSGGVRL
jgi:hypothetical protein